MSGKAKSRELCARGLVTNILRRVGSFRKVMRYCHGVGKGVLVFRDERQVGIKILFEVALRETPCNKSFKDFGK